jgi:hypothetical protein
LQLSADVLKDSMKLTHPNCDRHPNLQMVPCRLKRNQTVVSGHICPVPGCGRCHSDQSYLRPGDVELLAGPDLVVPAKKGPAKSISSDRPLNRHAAARAAILRAIEQNQRS